MRTLPAYLLCCMLFVTGCDDTLSISVDNPQDYPIEVQVDQQSFALDPGSHILISLPPGEHEVITYRDGQVSVRGFFTAEKDGLLNATRAYYIRLRDIYFRADAMAEPPAGILDLATIEVDQQPFTGDLVVYSDESLFIPKSWNQSPDESLPEPGSLKIRKSPGYRLVSKLYRVDDFLKEYGKTLIPVDTASYRAYIDSIEQALPQ